MVPSNSSISQLDKFLDVGGRLRKSTLTKAEQHLVIPPRKSAVSDANIQWSHNSVAHKIVFG